MTAIWADGSAITASESNAGPAIAYRPAPYALRTMTEILGTVASETALIIFAPWRMIPRRSTSVPIMKPGTSARKSSGISNASQSHMNLAALSAESLNSTPPFCIGWFATIATACPSRRAKPVSSSLANSFLISSQLSSSTMPSITLRMS